MDLSSLKNLSLKSQFAILGVAVLVFGVFITVQSSQQNQDVRQHAAGLTPTSTPTPTFQFFADLVGDNQTASNVGNLLGNFDTVSNVFGDVVGNNNTIYGNVFGCVIGNNNYVVGNVFGTVSGTSNKIVGNTLNAAQCTHTASTPTPTPTPTSAPTPTPTTVPTCSDGIDNNQNELIDAADPACHTDCNSSNPNSYDPTLTENNRCSLTPTVTPTSVPPTATPTIALTPTILPTTTVVPGDTSFSFDILLHGIGQGGDSANPASGGNTNPLHPHRTLSVDVYDVNNQLVVSKTGLITYNVSQGNFTGTVNMGTTLTTGNYTVKVKSDQFLRNLVPGIQTITAGVANAMPRTILINGDVNNDNQINILDYNILIGCYSDFLPPASCTSATKLSSDLDDDGNVNQFDYNLFLRELTNLQGQ